MFKRKLIVAMAVATLAILTVVISAFAQPGTLVGSVTFSVDCESGIGVGIAYDGTNLWYSCYEYGFEVSKLDLHRANPTTGVVSASFDIVATGGLGALSYDATRNVIWAGEGGGGPGGGPIYRIDLDAGNNVLGSALVFSTGDICGLDDGLAFDARNVADVTDDVLYYSDDCGTVIIDVYPIAGGAPVESFAWGGVGCYNSGLAVGGQLLYQGSDGCSHVWVVDKTTKAAAYDFSTVVAGDPNFRDEDLECDTNTFIALGKHVMWSKEAYSPMRAHAFEIEPGTCGVGGKPLEGRMTGGGSVFQGSRVTHGFELHCDISLPNNLEINWDGNSFHLTQLNSATCGDDPTISEEQPVAGFDTFVGSGVGRLNGVDGATIDFKLTDAGEPGKAVDIAEFSINVGADLTVVGTLDKGNHQAHPE